MALVFDRIAFRYKRSAPPVLDGLTWCVPPGRTVLLGPNGAGKSTLLALGANALRPWRGRVVIGELDPSRRRDRGAYRRTVGWMPQHVRAVPGLRAREQVAYAGWLKGLSRSEAWEAARGALARVSLSDREDVLTSTLSGGQQRRVGLAQVLVHDADALLLDEPTVGLDPAQRARFREIIGALPAERPIVVSTHQVDDLSDLFDVVVVIEDGTVRFQGSVGEFVALAPHTAERRAEAAYAQIISGER